jgi:ElaB/YqjD/DUF883 family membrane-anchored ribosome-binding protein
MARTIESHMRARSDALASQLDDLIASAGELLDNLNDQRSDATATLRSRATRNIENARRGLASLKRHVPEGTAEAARIASGFARRNPWTAVAVGAAIAASVGALLYMSLSDD